MLSNDTMAYFAPSFAVVVTSYRRPGLALRAVQSVLEQSYPKWNLIFVNDSPQEDYSEVERLIVSESRATYLPNSSNAGKNASMNKAFNHLAQVNFHGYVVFLDDDDWFDKDCLQVFARHIDLTEGKWLVSNRTMVTGELLTKNRTKRQVLNYYLDCLLTRRFAGDATHCIRFDIARRCYFPQTIKNAEEWFFFSQVAKLERNFRYLNAPGTLTEGYLPEGLTHVQMRVSERWDVYLKLLRELIACGDLNMSTGIYMVLRLGKFFL